MCCLYTPWSVRRQLTTYIWGEYVDGDQVSIRLGALRRQLTTRQTGASRACLYALERETSADSFGSGFTPADYESLYALERETSADHAHLRRGGGPADPVSIRLGGRQLTVGVIGCWGFVVCLYTPWSVRRQLTSEQLRRAVRIRGVVVSIRLGA